jgi:predicted nucleotidyltransferase
MVTTAAELNEAIEDFVRRLQTGIRVEALILYGSHAAGKAREWSDIDLAVISPDFESVPMNERQRLISKLTFERVSRVEPIGYPSSEYHNPGRHSFLREIIRTGRVVYEAPKT